MARRATFVLERTSRDSHTLVVDSGGFLSNDPGKRLAAEYISRSLGALGCEAINIGHFDLTFGGNFLLHMKDAYRLPLLSTNIFHADRRTPFVERWIIKRLGATRIFGIPVGGVRIAILGLVSGGAIPRVEADDPELVVTDPVASIEAALHRIRGRYDILILLAQMPFEHALEVARQIEEIDVIVAGVDWRIRPVPLVAGRQIFVHPSDQGKYVGIVDVAVRAGMRPQFVGGELVPLDVDIAEDRVIGQIVAEYLDRLRAEGRRPPPEEIEEGRRYFGEAACVPCHAAEHGQWARTRHARAMASLEEMGTAANYECLGCHTTGFREANAFWDVARDAAFYNVQCEACHGPRAVHVAAAGERSGAAREAGGVAAAVCLRCHTRAQDPEFDFARARESILHRERSR
ncbi:MAG: hypothetical protein AMJ46_07960 [Latescibacteria bacterium DG_63]|nr:MAG: hypothetical protein AMJ46_07960 [Latescibacteria bacterium DG_63]